MEKLTFIEIDEEEQAYSIELVSDFHLGIEKDFVISGTFEVEIDDAPFITEVEIYNIHIQNCEKDIVDSVKLFNHFTDISFIEDQIYKKLNFINWKAR